MNLTKYASLNGHSGNMSATSPSAPSKSVKLVIRPKIPQKHQSDAPPTTPLDVLAQELPPKNFDDQIPLNAIIDRIVQDAYSRLVELSDTLPGTAPQSRAREVDNYANETRKQFLKAYVLSKWAKVADDVETSMTITQYVTGHGAQIDQAAEALKATKTSLAGARVRNPDILSAVTILSQPPELQRSILPTIIRDSFSIEKPLSALQVRSALRDMNDVLRVRLRLWELLPLEWSEYTIDNGRVYFTCQELFTAAFTLTGRESQDTWYIIDMDFLVGVSPRARERIPGVFPQKIPPALWAQILPGVNAQLALNAKPPTEEAVPGTTTLNEDRAGESAPGDSEEEVVDAPLIRAFNLLQMLSLSYQLEILLYQANHLRTVGWADYLKIDMTRDRRSVNIKYWVRTAPFFQPRIPNAPPQKPPPMHGGTLSLSIISNSEKSSFASNTHPLSLATYTSNPHAERLARELQERSTLEAIQRGDVKGKGKALEPSDRVEKATLLVKWEAESYALGIKLPPGAFESESQLIEIDAKNLDCEAIIKTCIQRHSRTILRFFRNQIQNGPWQRFVAERDGAVIIEEDETPILRLALFKEQMLYISLDARMGRFILRDAGDLASWERGYRFASYADGLNTNPAVLLDAIVRLRFNTILEAIEHQVTYIGLQSYRQPGFARTELHKFGQGAHGYLFINLASFPSHYIVVIVTEEGFKYALVNTRRETLENRSRLLIADLGWLDPERLGLGPISNDFSVRADVLREIYAFGCARVSHTRVEQQLKSRGVPYSSVFPKVLPSSSSPHVQRNRAVPVLRVLARDLWSAPNSSAGDDAMGNIKISLMNWWNVKRSRVVTEVKLKSPPPISIPSSGHRSSAVSGPGLNPNSMVSYDPKSSVVSFVSGDAESSIDEFLAEWDRVQKTLTLARHVAQMSQKKGYEDVKLLSFNLLAIEFTYHSEYVAVIEYVPPVLMLQPGVTAGGTFKAFFSRLVPRVKEEERMDVDGEQDLAYNPHQEVASHLSSRIIEGNKDLTRQAVQEFVILLKSTLPILLELDSIRKDVAIARAKITNLPKVSILFKGAAWFRILYNTVYALDIRMLSSGQVAVLDGSFSFFNPTTTESAPLKPIPRLGSLVDNVIDELAHDKNLRRNLSTTGKPPPTIYNVSRGFRCDDALARIAARRLHENVLELLQDSVG